MADKNGDKWEVVGSSKPTKTKGKLAPVTNGSGKNSAAAKPMLKVEELITPLDSAYSILDPERRAQAKREALGIAEPKPVDKNKAKAAPTKEAAKKKPSKDASKEKEKEKIPRTLPDALDMLNVAEFNQLKETMKARFPGTSLFWLKEMVTYLNSHLNVETDPTFAGKPRDYPSSLLSAELRNIITSTFAECPADSLQAFYEQSVLTMPSEINRGAKVCGSKLMLQLLSFHRPSLAAANLARFKESLVNLESRVPASLSLLWVMSQAAVKDTNIGVQVWMEAMLPLIGLKNYAPFVGQVASQLTFKAKEVKSSKVTVTVADFFKLYDLVQGPTLTAAQQKDVQSLLLVLTRPMMTSYAAKMFGQFLHRLTSSTSSSYRAEICRYMVECLKTDASGTFEAWRREYKSNMAASAVLLKWCVDHESNFARKGVEFRTTLVHFRSVNNSFSPSAKRPEALSSCTDYTNALISDIQRPKTSTFSLKFLNYLLVLSIAGLVYYDVCHNGNGVFTDSRLGTAMERYGVNEQVARAYAHCEPYVTLVKVKSQPLIDNGLMYTIQLRDLIHQKGDEYFPGIWVEADNKYQMVIALVKEKSNCMMTKAGQLTDQAMKIGAEYGQIIGQKGAEYWTVTSEKAAEIWTISSGKVTEYWTVASAKVTEYLAVANEMTADYRIVVSEKTSEYWIVVNEKTAPYVEKMSDLATRIVNEERVQQAWKYTYDFYHKALHAVGICTH